MNRRDAETPRNNGIFHISAPQRLRGEPLLPRQLGDFEASSKRSKKAQKKLTPS